MTGPALGAGRVYVGSTTATGGGGVRALDVGSGATVWTRTLPLPVTATPDFVPSTGLLYVGTSAEGATARLYALDPASGRTVVAAPAPTGDVLRKIQFADGRLYAQTINDLFGFTAALSPLWDYLLSDDNSVFSTPNDGFLYFNEEGPDNAQCMQKVDGKTGVAVAHNCAFPQELIVPKAAGTTIVGLGGPGLVAFRSSDYSIRWTRGISAGGIAATADFGGRAVAVGGHLVVFLDLTRGDTLCRTGVSRRSFGGVDPRFDPGTGGAYVFDTAAQALVKVSRGCSVLWSYRVGAGLIDLDASSSTVVGSAGSTVFAVDG
jgi:outer membrane protein assembly factor BamB